MAVLTKFWLLAYVFFYIPDRFVPPMNDLYASELRLFQNFFCHSVDLIEKERAAPKTMTRYSTPKTLSERSL
jgi:hypothetical protein